jgi:hypothetical protein
MWHERAINHLVLPERQRQRSPAIVKDSPNFALTLVGLPPEATAPPRSCRRA